MENSVSSDGSDAGANSADMARLSRELYDELRRMAKSHLAQERAGHTLQPTALVHEVFLRLRSATTIRDRRRFFSVAAEAMRRILVDHARARRSAKRGGAGPRVDFKEEMAAELPRDDELVALNDALERFSARHPVAGQLVQLRYFAGLTIEESAELLEVSVATANRHWAFARAWLHAELSRGA